MSIKVLTFIGLSDSISNNHLVNIPTTYMLFYFNNPLDMFAEKQTLEILYLINLYL
jgi:hypothetical protein